MLQVISLEKDHCFPCSTLTWHTHKNNDSSNAGKHRSIIQRCKLLCHEIRQICCCVSNCHFSSIALVFSVSLAFAERERKRRGREFSQDPVADLMTKVCKLGHWESSGQQAFGQDKSWQILSVPRTGHHLYLTDPASSPLLVRIAIAHSSTCR